MRVHRLMAILFKLEKEKMVTATKLAEELEVSKRTIFRDIEELCQSGVPICSQNGKNGGYYIENPSKFEIETFFTDEIESLYLSTMGIGPREENKKTLENALEKLSHQLPAYSDYVQKLRNSFYKDEQLWWKERQEPNIDLIKKAMLSNTKIKLSGYVTSTDSVGLERIVRPYGIVLKNNQLYIVGFCENRNDIRVFMCSKIRSVSILQQEFQFPKDFNLREFWKRNVSNFKSYVQNNLTFTTIVKVINPDYHMPYNLATELIGNSIYQLKFSSFDNAAYEINLMGTNVVVVEPQELKKYFVRKYEMISQAYKEEPSSKKKC